MFFPEYGIDRIFMGKTDYASADNDGATLKLLAPSRAKDRAQTNTS